MSTGIDTGSGENHAGAQSSRVRNTCPLVLSPIPSSSARLVEEIGSTREAEEQPHLVRGCRGRV